MTTRSASAEGDRSSDLMIHCRVGAATSSAMIATPHNQFRTMRTRSTRYAIGSAVDDETLADMNHLVYRISINPLWTLVKRLPPSRVFATNQITWLSHSNPHQS